MMEVPKELVDDILSYCKVNNISDINSYLLRIIKTAQTIEKFGATPISRDIIVEKTVEVEKIVEKIVEVPIEKIVETVVEKQVFITDSSEIKVLADNILTLENKLADIQTKHREEISKLEGDNRLISDKLIDTQKLLEEEKLKNKNKGDIYGE